MTLLEHLKALRYPGRFIVIGKIGNGVLAVYGATGRSAASLARKYVMDAQKDVWATRVDTELEQKGNPELLEYQALKWFKDGFAIANGRHISTVQHLGVAQEALMVVAPEPDEYLTPRITGVVSQEAAALYMVRSVNGKTESKRWQLELEDGVGYFISTYTGEDIRPTQSFAGDPVKLGMLFGSAKDAAQEVFDALKPPDGESDYRVGVVGVSQSSDGRGVAIYNTRK